MSRCSRVVWPFTCLWLAVSHRGVKPGSPRDDVTRDETLEVLVADDDARVRRGLRSMIEASADLVVVGEAPSRHKALELDIQLRPDVVILDLLIPTASDGLGVLEELVNRGRPVVAISGWAPLRMRAVAAGAFAFLEKGPELSDRLLATIRSAAARPRTS